MKLFLESASYHLGSPDLPLDLLAPRALHPRAAALLGQAFLPARGFAGDLQADPHTERSVRQWHARLRTAVLETPADDLGRVFDVALRGLAELTDADHLRLMLHAGGDADPLATLLDDHLLAVVSNTRRISRIAPSNLELHLQGRCGAMLAVAALSGNVIHGHLVLESDAPRAWLPWQIRATRVAAQTLAALAVPA